MHMLCCPGGCVPLGPWRNMGHRRVRCRHCGRAKSPRARSWRGLCWSCYWKPAIRQSYPTRTNQFDARPRPRRRPDGPAVGRPIPDEPTEAPPGSRLKVEVLAERARRRQQLWHPEDAGGGG